MVSNSGQRLVWSVLLLFVFYAAGTFVFVKLERKAELKRYSANRELYEKMRDLYSFHYCDDPSFQSLSFCKNQASFSESLLDYFNEHGNSIVDKEQWTLLGSIFYLTHLATTVGYGSSHPQTASGQIATIVFALLGIPIMGYTLAQIARLELQTVVSVFEAADVKMNSARRQMAALWGILFIFMFGGAYAYTVMEPWSYRESLYFCFVTLSTVGFGDFLPSSSKSKIFSVFYMIFGLGVCMLIIAVLTGLVAEGHERVHKLVARDIEESDMCAGSCCGVRSSSDDGSPRADRRSMRSS
jgi:hypothetical protein